MATSQQQRNHTPSLGSQRTEERKPSLRRLLGKIQGHLYFLKKVTQGYSFIMLLLSICFYVVSLHTKGQATVIGLL